MFCEPFSLADMDVNRIYELESLDYISTNVTVRGDIEAGKLLGESYMEARF